MGTGIITVFLQPETGLENFHLLNYPQEDMITLVPETAEKVLEEFESAPPNLPQTLTHIAYEDQVLPALKNRQFP